MRADRINKAYERRKEQVQRNGYKKVPVFEFLDNEVSVEVLNGGSPYFGSEKFSISYEEFIRYISKGVNKGTENRWKNITVGEEVVLTVDTVKWEVNQDGYSIVERVGSPMFCAMGIKGNEFDYGSVYEVELSVGNTRRFFGKKDYRKVKDVLKVNKVYKLGGIVTVKGSSTRKEIPFLKDYLNKVIETDHQEIVHYKKEGISKYFNNLNNNYLTESFREEGNKSSRNREGIRWDNVK